ncbi:MAG: hypothetical protein JW793_11990 [Acidobacteria bacterium]|nr:hypothetical protein [Acidobacteriota bacterium]
MAKLVGIPLEDVLKALEVLQGPDQFSKNPEHEGRRLERTSEGFKVLNYCHYRARDYSMSRDAIRKREWRERAKEHGRDKRRDIVPPLSGHSASASVLCSSVSSSSKRKNKKQKSGYPFGFEQFWNVYPNKTAKVKAVEAWRRIDPQPDQALVDSMLAALEWQRQSEAWLKEGGKYIPHPATWLNGKRWDDECKGAVSKPDYSTWDVLNQNADQREAAQLGRPTGSRAIGQRPFQREGEVEAQAAAELAQDDDAGPETDAQRLEKLTARLGALPANDERRTIFNREIERLRGGIEQ